MPTYPETDLRKFAQKIFEACGSPRRRRRHCGGPPGGLQSPGRRLAWPDPHSAIRERYPQGGNSTCRTRRGGEGNGNHGGRRLRMELWAGGRHARHGSGMAKARSTSPPASWPNAAATSGAWAHIHGFAARQGFLAMGFCNSPIHGHFVLPWGGREPRLATNPISFAFPAGAKRPHRCGFLHRRYAGGKNSRLTEIVKRRCPKAGLWMRRESPPPIPPASMDHPWARSCPLGRESGYRGYALSLLVEVMGGALAGLKITGRCSREMAWALL